MLGKIVLTGLLIAAVFMLGRLSGTKRPRLPKGGAAPKRRIEAADELLECPHCGRFHAAEELCPCRRA
ncbi:MAG: hypothetical protein ACFBWO_05715 [Paracoccaceae bacterium]